MTEERRERHEQPPVLKKIEALRAKIDAHRPLDTHMLNQVRECFRIGMTYSSNALEGNSLTETETKIVIEDGITIGGKPVRDHLEALGHSEAYDLFFRLAKNQNITEANIKELHRLISTGSMRSRRGSIERAGLSSPGRISSRRCRNGSRF
jgi:Fic family protein